MRSWLLSCLVIGCFTAYARGQACQPYWVKPDPFDLRLFGNHFAVLDDGTGSALYAESFDRTFGNVHASIARWKGHGWQALEGLGMPDLVDAIFLWRLDDGSGPKLYAVGSYGPTLIHKCWRWTGSQWVEAPKGFYVPQAGPTNVRPICSFDDGTGPGIYGIRGVTPVKWTGSSWQNLGGPLNDNALLIISPGNIGAGMQLIAVGTFTQIGTVACDGAAAWDGQAWHPFGSIAAGVANAWAMETFDDGNGPKLYLGGGYYLNNTLYALIRWSGTAWEPVPGAPLDAVRGLKVFNDGTGPALFVTGDFPGHIRKFTGTTWSTLGAGSGPVSAEMAVYDDGRGPSLFVSMAGGVGAPAGGGVVGPGTVQWVGCPNCYANCDNTTGPSRLNANDFMCFLNRYVAKDPYANCTVDAVINAADFQCFINKYATGCP